MKLEKIIETLRQFSTTELCDGMTEYRVLDPAIHRMVTEKKIVGPAFPVEIPAGVSGLIPDALTQIQSGQVLVIDAKGYTRQTCWGDYRSFCAALRQVEGIVIDGMFRDLDGCKEAGVPIFARGTVPRAGGKERLGQINVPIMLGEVRINPGDIIVGDADGIVVIQPDEAEEIMKRAKEKAELEQKAVRFMKETGTLVPRASQMFSEKINKSFC